MQQPAAILAQLGLTDSEVKVYLAMCRGLKTARDIIKATRQKRPTVYYALSKLEERGLVRKTGRGGEERFAVEPPERLKTIADRQKAEATKLEKEVAELIPSLATKTAGLEKPHVSFYEGVEAVKNVIMETLYCRDRHIDSIAPNDNFFWQVGQSFADAYVSERVARRIGTRNLWEAIREPKLIKKYYEGLSDIRILPAAMHGKFVTTIFLFDDKALYISSLKNAYALLVTSKEHHDTMQALFDGLWSASKAVK